MPNPIRYCFWDQHNNPTFGYWLFLLQVVPQLLHRLPLSCLHDIPPISSINNLYARAGQLAQSILYNPLFSGDICSFVPSSPIEYKSPPSLTCSNPYQKLVLSPNFKGNVSQLFFQHGFLRRDWLQDITAIRPQNQKSTFAALQIYVKINQTGKKTLFQRLSDCLVQEGLYNPLIESIDQVVLYFGECHWIHHLHRK